MPKSGKLDKGDKHSFKRTLSEKFSDVTLNDFANCAGRVGRLKKSTSNAINRQVKQITNVTDSDLAWYEKDLEDFNIDYEPNFEDQEDCDNHLPPIKSNKSKKKKPSTNPTCSTEDDKGVEYPLDIWFLISEFVKPEDVATFACICKSAHTVVNSPKFWFSLYKRYYTTEVKLPQRLRPECMERPHSLKACVIRALFHMYPPFIERVRSSAPFDSEPHLLMSWCCVLMWHRKNRNAWDFYFKFHRDCSSSSNYSRYNNSRRPDLLEMLEDVLANSEDGCRVLQVTCLNFVSTPAVMGMYLTGVILNVGHIMYRHKLKLTFSNTPYKHKQYNQDAENVTIIFDPVSNIRVLNWWHPHYPRNET